MDRQEILYLISLIGPPEVYDTDYNIIVLKTNLIKNFQKKNKFKFEEIKNLYLLEVSKLKKLLEHFK